MHFLNHRQSQGCRLSTAFGSGSAGGSAFTANVNVNVNVTVLDAAALERLRALDPTGENQLMSRVLNAFNTSLTRLMPQLAQAQATQDCPAIRHVAHTLKSSSASIGALQLSKLCTELEAAARAFELEGLDARVNAMRAEAEVVLLALKQSLATQP
jgi:two-component system, sensor histidine kinase and response regulator